MKKKKIGIKIGPESCSVDVRERRTRGNVEMPQCLGKRLKSDTSLKKSEGAGAVPVPILSINHSGARYAPMFDRNLRNACRDETKKRKRWRPSGFESLPYAGQEEKEGWREREREGMIDISGSSAFAEDSTAV